MQLDNKEKDVVLVDNGEVKSGLADMGSLQPKRAPPTRRLPPLVDETNKKNAFDDMVEKADATSDSIEMSRAILDRDSSHVVSEDGDPDDADLEDITHNAPPDRDLPNLRAWREETDQALYFISDWEALQAVRAESEDLEVGLTDEDLHDFEEATRASKPEMIRFNRFLAAHNCNLYSHDPSLTFDEDFAKCATAWVWLPGTEAYGLFRTRALAGEGCTQGGGKVE